MLELITKNIVFKVLTLTTNKHPRSLSCEVKYWMIIFTHAIFLRIDPKDKLIWKVYCAVSNHFLVTWEKYLNTRDRLNGWREACSRGVLSSFVVDIKISFKLLGVLKLPNTVTDWPNLFTLSSFATRQRRQDEQDDRFEWFLQIGKLQMLVHDWPVWPDWSISESSCWQIILQK